MKHYKTLGNSICAFESDGSQDAYIKADMTLLTDAELTVLRTPPPPTPMQQIRTLEQANDDDQRKLNRQAAIDTALTVACRSPAAAAMTRDQVHVAYYASNRGYKSMVDLEAACAALRKLIV